MRCRKLSKYTSLQHDLLQRRGPIRARSSFAISCDRASNSAGSGRGKCQSAHSRDRQRCPTGQRVQVVEQIVGEGCRLAWVDVGGRSSTKTLKTLLNRKPGGQHGLQVVWCSRYTILVGTEMADQSIFLFGSLKSGSQLSAKRAC